MTSTMINLQKRGKGVGIIKVADYDNTKIVPDFSIENATTVILRHGQISILVGEVRPNPNESFVGKVTGFEPPDTTISGVNEGEKIEFREEHILSMGR